MVWHGGEPLAAGREHLAALMAPFARRRAPRADQRHARSTTPGASSSSSTTCGSSVSVDGPARAQRRAGRPRRRARRTTGSCAASTALRRHGIPFSALCVVVRPAAGPGHGAVRVLPRPGLRRARHQHRGAARGSTPRANAHAARRCGRSGPSWSRPGAATRGSRCARSSGRCGTPAAVLAGTADELLPRRLDPIPTIGHDGRWCCSRRSWPASPTPGTATSRSGNVLDHAAGARSSRGAAPRRPGSPSSWPGSRRAGRPARTSASAAARHAANRYFEHGRFDGTETEHCRNSKIRLLEGVLDHARDH